MARTTTCLVAFALTALATTTLAIDDATAACPRKSVTQASGFKAKTGPYCPGNLIFEDNFNTFDTRVWKHEIMNLGANNEEFQYYVNNRQNSFVKNGLLHIHPTVSGNSPSNSRVNSARMISKDAISCKFCRVKIRAKMPSGDWTWPALWMMPKKSVYGEWPRSGEIDIAEVRGNNKLYQNGQNIGGERNAATLHFGLDRGHDGFLHATKTINSKPGQGYNKGFHDYELVWTPNYIKFNVDGHTLYTVNPGSKTFWELGGFNRSGMKNPWARGSRMAPFDQQFFIILNVAIGGSFFPDNSQSPKPKPWRNGSPTRYHDFFAAKNNWLPSWQKGAADLIVDYVKVYAV